MATYPSVRPNYVKELALPDYGVKTFTMEDGTEVRRKTFDKGYKTGLKFVYEGVTAAETATIMNFWQQMHGNFGEFFLPPAIFTHPSFWNASMVLFAGNISIDPTLSSTDFAIAFNTALQAIPWRFDGKPIVLTNVVDIYSFDITILSMV